MVRLDALASVEDEPRHPVPFPLHPDDPRALPHLATEARGPVEQDRVVDRAVDLEGGRLALAAIPRGARLGPQFPRAERS